MYKTQRINVVKLSRFRMSKFWIYSMHLTWHAHNDTTRHSTIRCVIVVPVCVSCTNGLRCSRTSAAWWHRKPILPINRIIIASCCGPALITGFRIYWIESLDVNTEIGFNFFYLFRLLSRRKQKKMLEICVDSFESAKAAVEGGILLWV